MALNNVGRWAGVLLAVSGLASTVGMAGVPVTMNPQPPVMVSVRMDGLPAGGCGSSRFSPNRRYLSFACLSSDIVPNDTNDAYDLFLLDRNTGVADRVSLTGTGEELRYPSPNGAPADDGKRVMFEGTGPFHPDLLPFPYSPPDGGGWTNAFLRHRDSGSTDLLTRDSQGRALRDATGPWDADLAHNEILFGYRGNLFTGPDPNPASGLQLWIRDWQSGSIELVTVTPLGQPSAGSAYAATFSASGRFVAFNYSGNDLGYPARPQDTHVVIRDRELGTTTRLTYSWQGGEFTQNLSAGYRPRASADGRFVLFETNNREIHPDASTLGGTLVYLLDRQTGVLDVISRNRENTGYSSFNSPSDMSDDGRYVAWFSRTFDFSGPPVPTTEHIAIWVLDRQTGQRVNVTAPLGPLDFPEGAISLDLSGDGSMIAFTWRINDPTQPLLSDSVVYTVQLRDVVPYQEPVPVPVVPGGLLLSLAALGLLVSGLAFQCRRRCFH